jgi:5-formyltetrahydrofolate cyclo-ligase
LTASNDVSKIKSEIRRQIWERMIREKVALPPFPIEGRIPNFKGADRAAKRLVEDKLFQEAEVVFCSPDSPQRHVREAVLRSGKILVMATPRLREGFIVLDPRKIEEKVFHEAATIKGAFKYGRLVTLDLPVIDLKVTGSVAVSRDGGRVGKGGGFSDLEFAILKTIGVIVDETPVVTTVHDLQLVEAIPMLKHDVPLDALYTPEKKIYTTRKLKKPEGIYWDLIPIKKFEEIPLLKILRDKNLNR